MHRQDLLQLLSHYRPHNNAEAGYLARTQAFIREQPDCFNSCLAEGHVTGSAWVVSPSREGVLLLHHRKHDQWFQPGGHADGDHDILRVALRETHEETGLPPEQIRLVDGTVFDLDIHHIPASHRGPAHWHYDVRFLIEVDDQIPVPGNDESHQVLWVPLHQVARFNNNLSSHRMVEKTRRLR
ncbi:MAG: NUDIX hydrolase [Gammaproteobacteria bacterium]|nr:NUDIX hydrolase [Gammaproteobacteria bacterium]